MFNLLKGLWNYFFIPQDNIPNTYGEMFLNFYDFFIGPFYAKANIFTRAANIFARSYILARRAKMLAKRAKMLAN